MLSFGILNGEKVDDKDDNDYILFDPTRNEEEVINGRITITMNIYKDIQVINITYKLILLYISCILSVQ